MLPKSGSPSSGRSKIVLISERWKSPLSTSSFGRKTDCMAMFEEWWNDLEKIVMCRWLYAGNN